MPSGGFSFSHFYEKYKKLSSDLESPVPTTAINQVLAQISDCVEDAENIGAMQLAESGKMLLSILENGNTDMSEFFIHSFNESLKEVIEDFNETIMIKAS